MSKESLSATPQESSMLLPQECEANLKEGKEWRCDHCHAPSPDKCRYVLKREREVAMGALLQDEGEAYEGPLSNEEICLGLEFLQKHVGDMGARAAYDYVIQLRADAESLRRSAVTGSEAKREDFIQVNDTLDVAECCVHDQIKNPLEREETQKGLKRVRDLALSALRLSTVAGDAQPLDGDACNRIYREALDQARAENPVGADYRIHEAALVHVYAAGQRSITRSAITGWISVKERFPDDGGFVLAVCADGAMDLYTSTLVRDYANDPDDRARITHWQPLPEKPNATDSRHQQGGSNG